MTMRRQESSNTKEVTRKSVDEEAEEKLSKTINDAIRKIDLKVEIQVEVGDSKVFRLHFTPHRLELELELGKMLALFVGLATLAKFWGHG